MTCNCRNNTGLVFGTGTQVFGFAGIISCDAGESLEHVQLTHNGQTVNAPNGSTTAQGGTGTIGYANGAVQLSGVPPGQYAVNFTMSVDGVNRTCGHTITIQGNGTSSNCLNLEEDCPVGQQLTITPGQVQADAEAFVSPTSDIVDSEVDPDSATNVSGATTTALTIDCNNPGQTVFGIMMADGSTCQVVVNVTGSTLNCIGSPISSTPGGTITGAQIASGGTAPYTITASSSATFAISGGNAIVSSTANPGAFNSTFTVQDANGASTECTVSVNVTGGGSNSCFDADSNFSVSPNTGPAGTVVNITANVNPNTGGLAGYFLRMKDPLGNLISPDPAFVQGSGNQWTWTIPANCTDGSYSVCAFPPAGTANCDPLEGVASVTATGCSGTGACSQVVTSPTVTPSTSAAGGAVTISVPNTQCNCPGFGVDVSITTPSGGTITASPTADPHTFTAVIPANVGNYNITARCCPS